MSKIYNDTNDENSHVKGGLILAMAILAVVALIISLAFIIVSVIMLPSDRSHRKCDAVRYEITTRDGNVFIGHNFRQEYRSGVISFTDDATGEWVTISNGYTTRMKCQGKWDDRLIPWFSEYKGDINE